MCEGDGTSCLGCTDAAACNYDSSATGDDGSCTYAEEGFNCDGSCVDTDMDGVCDSEEVLGCTSPNAVNFNPAATENDNSCVFFPCGSGTTYDPNTNRCELDAWLGETGDMSMLDPCHVDFDGSGVVDVTDLARIKVVIGEDPGMPAMQCGAGVIFDATLNGGTGACVPAPLTMGEGNGLNNLNPRFFDLNRDAVLDQEDFDRLEVLLGASCAD